MIAGMPLLQALKVKHVYPITLQISQGSAVVFVS